MNKRKVKNAGKILVINLGGIGDCLLSTPALKGLCKAYPKAHIVFLTVSRSGEILKGIDYIDEIITVDMGRENNNHFLILKKWYNFCKLLLSLREKRFDMIINMRTLFSLSGSIKMAFVFLTIGARYRVGRDTKRRGFFLNIKLPETHLGAKHDVDSNIELVMLLGAGAEDRRPELNLTAKDRQFADDFIKNCGIGEKDIIIGITSGAPWPSKRWPLKNFVDVADALSKTGYKVIIMGGEEEKYMEYMFQNIDSPNVISAIGRTSVLQLAALIERCNAHITNDTGPMHIAATLRTPLVAIFGPGDLTRFDPREISDNAVILYNKSDCAPCEKAYCYSGQCLADITPEEVIKACLELIKRRPIKAVYDQKTL